MLKPGELLNFFNYRIQKDIPARIFDGFFQIVNYLSIAAFNPVLCILITKPKISKKKNIYIYIDYVVPGNIAALNFLGHYIHHRQILYPKTR